MKQITPSLPDQLCAIIEEHFPNTDPTIGLTLLDEFLEKYPYHAEALLTKAVWLMAFGRDDEAHVCIETMKSTNLLDRRHIYDEAELLYEKDKVTGTEYMCKQLEGVMDDIVTGVDHFLNGIDASDDLRKRLRKKLLDTGYEAFTNEWKEQITDR